MEAAWTSEASADLPSPFFTLQNHLDLHAVLWLEAYLTKWPKTFIVVSHAREFLNTVTLSCCNILCLVTVYFYLLVKSVAISCLVLSCRWSQIFCTFKGKSSLHTKEIMIHLKGRELNFLKTNRKHLNQMSVQGNICRFLAYLLIDVNTRHFVKYKK